MKFHKHVNLVPVWGILKDVLKVEKVDFPSTLQFKVNCGLIYTNSYLHQP